MERSKSYPGISLSHHGWNRLTQIAKTYIDTEFRQAILETKKDQGKWSFDRVEDFLSDLNPLDSHLHLFYENEQSFGFAQGPFNFQWVIKNIEKEKIVRFEAAAHEVIQKNKVALPEPPEPDYTTRVFIGHGSSPDWRELKDHLSDKHNISIECYETGSRAGHTIRDVLEDMLGASNLAILVHTPEDELADGGYNSRPNVIHETGLFQGKLGFSRAIVLLKEGTKEFTNLSGIQQIRYSNIRESYGDVLAWLKRETEKD